MENILFAQCMAKSQEAEECKFIYVVGEDSD